MRPIDGDALLELYDNTEVCNIDNYSVPISVVRQNIIDAPTIKPYGTWIPCSERLPKVEGSYITTTEYGAVRVNHFYTRNNTWGYKSNRTIAWMPLPEPWKGDEL